MQLLPDNDAKAADTSDSMESAAACGHMACMLLCWACTCVTALNDVNIVTYSPHSQCHKARCRTLLHPANCHEHYCMDQKAMRAKNISQRAEHHQLNPSSSKKGVTAHCCAGGGMPTTQTPQPYACMCKHKVGEGAATAASCSTQSAWI